MLRMPVTAPIASAAHNRLLEVDIVSSPGGC